MKKLDIFANKKKKEIQDDSKTIPFYGLKGTICKIEEKEHIYVVTRYGLNGEEGEKLITPKKKKKAIEENYIEDIRKYLQKNWDKYSTSLKQQPKNIISKKKILASTGVTTSLAIASGIGIILSRGTMMTACLPTFLITFTASCNELKKLKDYRKETKEKEFRKKYEYLTKEVNEYNINNTKPKTNSTVYSNIEQNRKESKIIGDKRVLKKVA